MGSNEYRDLEKFPDDSNSFGEKEKGHQDNHNDKSDELPATAPRRDEEKADSAGHGVTETVAKNEDQNDRQEVPKSWYSGLLTGAGGSSPPRKESGIGQ
ncbi:hypothetical protein PG996_010076 [Apiospora saccharicola]|uniref:Uncharacterized protein n=1 Tax=Apiospora saccharicola TaxID=335842 RepID=A0ABR1UML5_9PEZI